MSRIVFTDVDVNDERTITVVWKNEVNVATDSVTTVQLRDPDGTTTTPVVAHPTTGTYSFTQKYSKALSWFGRVVTDDALTQVEEFEVRVNSTPFYP